MKLIVKTPFDPETGRKPSDEVALINNKHGASLGYLLESEKDNISAVVINGENFPDWGLFIPGRDDDVVVWTKNPHSYEFLVGLVINLVLSLALSVAIKLLTPTPKKPDSSKAQPGYAIAGVQNTIAPGTTKFIVAGERDVFGHLIASKTTLITPHRSSKTLFRKMTFDVVYFMGVGEIEDLTKVRSKGTHIEDFPFQWEWRKGTDDQTVFDGHEQTSMVYSIGAQIPTPILNEEDANTTITGTTRSLCDKATLFIQFNGIFGIRTSGGDAGTMHEGWYVLQIRYKRNSDAVWTTDTRHFRFQAQTKNTVFTSIELPFAERGRWDWSIQCIDIRIVSQQSPPPILVNVMETINITTAYPGSSLLRVKGIASEQVSSIDSLEISARVKGILVDVLDEECGVLIKKWTNMRPWIIRYLCTNAEHGLGSAFRDDVLEIASLRTGAQYAVEQVEGYAGLEDRDHCDVIINDKRPGWEWIRTLTFEGDAYLIPALGKIQYLVDKGEVANARVRGYAWPGNILGGSFNREYGSDDRPKFNTVLADYPDSASDYKSTPAKLFQRGGLAGQPERSDELSLVSIVRKSQAARKMRRHMDKRQLIDAFYNFKTSNSDIVSMPLDVCPMSFRTSNRYGGFSGYVGYGSSGSNIKLDRPVTLEAGKTYAIYVVIADKNITATQTISTPTGENLSEVDLVSALIDADGVILALTSRDMWMIGEESVQIKKILIDSVTRTPDYQVEMSASIYDQRVYDGESPLPNITGTFNTVESTSIPRQPIMIQVRDISVGGQPYWQIDVVPGFDGLQGIGTRITEDTVALAAAEPTIDDFFLNWFMNIDSTGDNRITDYDGSSREATTLEASIGTAYRLTKSDSAPMVGYKVEKSTTSSGPWTFVGEVLGESRSTFPASSSSSGMFFRITPISSQGVLNTTGRWVVGITAGAGDVTAPAVPISVVLTYPGSAVLDVTYDSPLARDTKEIQVELHRTTIAGSLLDSDVVSLENSRDESLEDETTVQVGFDDTEDDGTVLIARARIVDYFGNASAWVDSETVEKQDDEFLSDNTLPGVVTASVTVFDTISETVVFTTDVPAGALTIDGGLLATVHLKVSDTDPLNNATLTLKAYYDTTVVGEIIAITSDGLTSIGADKRWIVEATILGKGTNTSQRTFFEKRGIEANTSGVYPGVNTAIDSRISSVDSKVQKVFKITATWSVADVTLSAVRDGAEFQYIKASSA